MADLVYPPVILSARGMFVGLGLSFRTVGADHVPRSGGAVLASNHVSYLDFIFVGKAAQPSKRLVRFMAKDSVFAHPVGGPLMRGMKHIPVDRSAGADAFRAAVTAVRSGEVVGVFPEATMSRSFELKSFKNGAARIAAETGAPLIPMITFGGQRLWTKGRKPTTQFGVTIALTVGEPLHPTPEDDPNEVTEVLKARMTGLLEDTLAAYRDRPAPGAWWWPARLGGTAPTPDEAAAMDAAERESRRDS